MQGGTPRSFVQVVVSNLSVTCKWNKYLPKLRKHLLLHVLPCAKVFKSVCSVLIECDGLCCGGRAPFALLLCVCVQLCRGARRLVECWTVLLLPSWRVAWAGGASRMGTRRAKWQDRDPNNVLPSICGSAYLRFNFNTLFEFYLFIFLWDIPHSIFLWTTRLVQH